MEKFLNLFLRSELSLLDFCKQYNLSRVEFEGYINDKGYYWKNGRSGIKVNLFKLAIDDYVNSLEYNHNDKNSKTRVLEIACRPGLNILHKLYSHSKIYLKRKYERYLEYCRLYEESYRELETNNGEGCDVNPVISTESKESVPS